MIAASIRLFGCSELGPSLTLRQRDQRRTDRRIEGFFRDGDSRTHAPRPHCPTQTDMLTIAFDVTYVTGARGARTPDLLHAMQTRSQLRHGPWVSSCVIVSGSGALGKADF